jgi:hypothetical protein
LALLTEQQLNVKRLTQKAFMVCGYFAALKKDIYSMLGFEILECSQPHTGFQLFLNSTRACRVAEGVEHLPNKHKALSSRPGTTKEKK